MESNLFILLLEPKLKRLRIDGTNGNSGSEHAKVVKIGSCPFLLKKVVLVVVDIEFQPIKSSLDRLVDLETSILSHDRLADQEFPR